MTLALGVQDQAIYSTFEVNQRRAEIKKCCLTPKDMTPKDKGWPLLTYHFNEWLFKEELYNSRIGRFREIQNAIKLKKPIPTIPRIWFPTHMDEEFVSELCQEAKVWDERKKKWIWKEPDSANDFGDALKMNLVLWYAVSPLLQRKRMSEAEEAAKSKSKAA